MFAFVVPVGDPVRYARLAAPGIERVREPDSLVLPIPGTDAPALRVNEALDELAVAPDLEGVVVLHEDIVLEDPSLLAILRGTLGDPQVALAGLVGAQELRGLDWWEGTAVGTLGTPHLPARAVRGHRPSGDVAVLDGSVLCFGPWAVRHLRFDPALTRDFHGYDVDLCAQARHHGRRIVVVPAAAHHEHRALLHDPDRWARSELRFRARWMMDRPLGSVLQAELTSAAPRAREAAG